MLAEISGTFKVPARLTWTVPISLETGFASSPRNAAILKVLRKISTGLESVLDDSVLYQLR